MTRIPTIGLDATMVTSMRNARSALTAAQVQLSTGRKSETYAGLGTDAGRSLSARSIVARQTAYVAAGKQASETLDRTGAEITALRTATETFRDAVRNAMGSGDASGLTSEAGALFAAAKQTLNAQQGGRYLFGGTQTSTPPFRAGSTTAASAAADPAILFANDDVTPTARIADGADLPTGFGADVIGRQVIDAMRAFTASGTPESALSADQITALGAVATLLDSPVNGLIGAEAENGRRANRADSYMRAAQTRVDVFKSVASNAEDVDLADVAIRLSREQTALQASLQSVAKISGLTLASFL